MDNLTPANIFENQVGAFIQQDPDEAKNMDVVYQFHITGDDPSDWIVDLSQRHDDGPCVKQGTIDAADCTITIDSGQLVGIVDGSVNPVSAFMFGQIKVVGDMSVAAKLQTIFRP